MYFSIDVNDLVFMKTTYKTVELASFTGLWFSCI